MADNTNPVSETDKEREAKIDREVWGGPTVFINRVNVQGYGGAGIRLSFAEQFSSDLDVLPAFRAAVYMHPSVATSLAQFIVNSLPPGSVTVPPFPSATPNPLQGLGAALLGAGGPSSAGTAILTSTSANKLTGKP